MIMMTIAWMLLVVPGLTLIPAAGFAAEPPKSVAPGGEGRVARDVLESSVGDYTTVIRFALTPGGAPEESKGVARIESILDGRFIEEEHSGTMMGEAVRGKRLYGYNEVTRQYETSWVYSGSTAILAMTGTSDDGGRTISFSGGFEDASGRQTLSVVRRQIDEDRFTVTMMGRDADARRFATLETTYTRKR